MDKMAGNPSSFHSDATWEIAFDRLIQRAGLDPVKRGEIEIQDHLFAANPVDLRSDGRRGKGKGVLWHGVTPHKAAIAVGSPGR